MLHYLFLLHYDQYYTFEADQHDFIPTWTIASECQNLTAYFAVFSFEVCSTVLTKKSKDLTMGLNLPSEPEALSKRDFTLKSSFKIFLFTFSACVLLIYKIMCSIKWKVTA